MIKLVLCNNPIMGLYRGSRPEEEMNAKVGKVVRDLLYCWERIDPKMIKIPNIPQSTSVYFLLLLGKPKKTFTPLAD